MEMHIMSYVTEDIIRELKQAREAKGLSQRALSQRTHVPQSHISKIESGGTDIRLSSLIELARALDLELKQHGPPTPRKQSGSSRRRWKRSRKPGRFFLTRRR